MTLILLAVSLSIALCVIAFNFAIYAPPFMVGLAAFRYVYATDASVAMSFIAALGAAGLPPHPRGRMVRRAHEGGPDVPLRFGLR